jgi:hypothetical protein
MNNDDNIMKIYIIYKIIIIIFLKIKYNALKTENKSRNTLHRLS